MEDFEIIKGFRNERDIDRIKVDIDTLSSWQDCKTFLEQNNLKGMSVRDKSFDKHTVDMSFLKDFSFLEYLEWLVPLSKKSNILSLFTLPNLKYLRWIPDNTFDIDFSLLPGLHTLVTSDYGRMENWNKLTKMKVLHISQLNKKDCTFISDLKEMTDLQLTRAKTTSINGLESCDKLERLDLVYCQQITELVSVLKNIPSLRSVSIRKCKSITKDEVKRIEDLGVSVWHE